MISKNHEVSGLFFCEIKFGSGKRTATHGAFVGKSRLVSDQIDSGNLARRASWPIVRCDGPRADLSFFREARLGTYRAEVGLGELEPIDNHHQQACWLVVSHKRNRFWKLWEAPKRLQVANSFGPLFFFPVLHLEFVWTYRLRMVEERHCHPRPQLTMVDWHNPAPVGMVEVETLQCMAWC